jgi:hypothetical protein
LLHFQAIASTDATTFTLAQGRSGIVTAPVSNLTRRQLTFEIPTISVLPEAALPPKGEGPASTIPTDDPFASIPASENTSGAASDESTPDTKFAGLAPTHSDDSPSTSDATGDSAFAGNIDLVVGPTAPPATSPSTFNTNYNCRTWEQIAPQPILVSLIVPPHAGHAAGESADDVAPLANPTSPPLWQIFAYAPLAPTGHESGVLSWNILGGANSSAATSDKTPSTNNLSNVLSALFANPHLEGESPSSSRSQAMADAALLDPHLGASALERLEPLLDLITAGKTAGGSPAA